MTMNEMNARVLKKSVVLSLLCGSGAALLSACAFNPVTDPNSPLNARIEALVAENDHYPKLEDFPAPPADVPTAGDVKAQVQQLAATENRLSGEVANIDWQDDQDPEAYAAAVRSRVDEGVVNAPTPETPAEIEAFARQLRERAKAPPPIDRPMR